MFTNIIQQMKNRIVSVLAGIFSGWLIVALGDIINHKLFPAPSGLDYTNKAELRVFIDSLPIAAFISMLFVFALSAFIGGVVTGKIAKSNWQRLCFITGIILLVTNIINMFVIPQPVWFNIASITLYIPFSYIGGRIINQRKEK